VYKRQQLLSSNQWKSSSYDPFDSHNSSEIELIRYDLITAFEVFEHAVNPNSIFNNITNFATEESLIFISTLLNDGNIAPNKRLEWWYASPRNGHISLFSSLSLKILAEKFGFNFASLGVGYHIFYKKLPLWTNTLIQTC
jgi:2-polyprenyl-3-methyl-5-hydroxy-6-metoxy-1,4-benzoquinol methylase